MTKIQKIQNRCIRLALGIVPDPMTYRQVSNSAIHQMTNIETIEQFSDRIAINFYEKMIDHENMNIRNLYLDINYTA